MYRYCYRAPLKNLEAQGNDSLLTFETSSEKASVYLNQSGEIDRVIHIDKIKIVESVILASQAKHVVVGTDNCKRDVYHFLVPGKADHLTLRLGLTIHSGEGTWSSLPHDFEENLEPDFEEVFFYSLSGGSGRAYQVGRGVWMDGSSVDSVWPISHQSFSTVPMGYHPVVGEPGVKVKYVWGYIAKFPRWEKI